MPVIAPYTPPTPFRPPGEAVPSADELEALQQQLENLRQQSLDRARKAGDDLRTIDEAMRKLKEKEKGKAKAAEKVKRERGCASKYGYCWSVVLTRNVINLPTLFNIGYS